MDLPAVLPASRLRQNSWSSPKGHLTGIQCSFWNRKTSVHISACRPQRQPQQIHRRPAACAKAALRSEFAGQQLVATRIRMQVGSSSLRILASAEVAEVETKPSTVETATVHYYRKDGAYEGWGLHLWGDVKEATGWDTPLLPGGEDSYGVYWEVPLTADAKSVDFMVHKGDDKDSSGSFSPADAATVWLVGGRSTVFLQEPDLTSLPQGNLDLARAFWVTADTLAWNLEAEGAAYTLYASRDALLKLTGKGVEGADVSVQLEVEPAGLADAVKEKFPHIANYTALKLAPNQDVSSIVKGQVALAAVDAQGSPLDATSVQLPGVLDDLYAYNGPLGASLSADGVSLHVWAPTAQSVHLLLFDGPTGGEHAEKVAMKEEKGVWSISGAPSWQGRYYLYEVKVFHPATGKVETGLGVDPYSRGLSANGERSLIVDLGDRSLAPEGWANLHSEKPPLETFNDISILELHVRDFSISDETVDTAKKGGYLAFTEKDTAGIRHLKGLADVGLTHVHLLPTFDFSSVNERKETWKSIDEAHLATLPPDSEEQQAAVVAIQDEDGFNWGYDPVNWGVPDGSYASDPDGPTRTLEFRTMVQALNKLGLRVVLDVVYNHTHGSGHFDRGSVLDKIVPGYYLRRNADGYVENSTCMNNTASEHYMLDRAIVDDLLMWARQYKVDGFRFDLMGHLMKSTMVRARDALRALTAEKDGVDGSKLYLYGEGWDFGEISKNQRGVNAGQLNLAGTGIGSFNDRIRDTAMGGSPFGDPQQQGFLTGLFLQPNELDQGDESAQAKALAATTDWIRVGLTGNLRDFSFMNHEGQQVKGGEVLTHDGVPVGYTASPEEVVNYVSAHDNETLFDVIMLKTAREVSLQERCRINHVATSLVALQQGVAFFHAGDDMLRSKSLDRDSYNSGDWFNKLDFSYQSNNYGVGLPPKGKNGEKWKIMQPLLAEPSLKPGPTEIKAAVANLRELLTIRYSSPLFRLRTAKDVQDRLEFFNTGPNWLPGVIGMSLRDGGDLPQIDPTYRRVVVVFNARPDEATVALPFHGSQLTLHSTQEAGHDELVKTAKQDGDALVVPARTTAVFVERHT